LKIFFQSLLNNKWPPIAAAIGTIAKIPLVIMANAANKEPATS
jgi:hypothetical protein